MRNGKRKREREATPSGQRGSLNPHPHKPKIILNSNPQNNLKEYAKELLRAGFQPIPLEKNSKKPACSWKGLQERRMTEEEVESYQWDGIGILLGTISGGLVVFDADTPLAKRLLELHPILRDTAKVRTPTKNGIHYYIRIIDYPKDGVRKAQLYSGEIKIDLLAEGSLAVFPPTELNGGKYEWIRGLNYLKELTYEEFNKLKEEITHALERAHKWDETLRLVKGVYKEGSRQFINLYLSGYLVKLGIPEFEALAHFSRLWEEAGDEETELRERAIRDTYKDFHDGKAITGWNGLQEIFKDSPHILERLETIWEGERKAITPTTPEIEQPKHKSGAFIIEGGEVYKLTRKGLEVLGPYIEVQAVLFDEERERRLVLARYRGKVFAFTLREAKEKIEEYTAQAIRHRGDYLAWLSEEIKRAPEKRLIKTTGWSEDLKEFHHPLRGKEDWVFDDGHILKKEKRGIIHNPELQKELVHKALKEGRYLGLLYVCSLASILLYPLEIEPFVVIITGLSKSGKSLTSTLAVQLFYKCSPPIATGLQTRNSWEFHLRRFIDLPFLFDELALMDKDLVELIAFAVNSGYGRSRGDTEQNVNRARIRSVVFLNAERFPYRAIRNAGALRRVLHIKVDTTEDLTGYRISEEEKKAVGFGLELIEYAKEFLEKEKAKIERLTDMVPIKKALYIALGIYEQYYGEPFNTLRELIDKTIEEQERIFEEENNQVQRFLDRLREDLSSNRGLYMEGDGKSDIKGARGKIELTENGLIVHLFPEAFNKLLKDEFGEEILNRDVILRGLEKMGLLKTEKGRKQNRVRINGTLSRVYTIILRDD